MKRSMMGIALLLILNSLSANPQDRAYFKEKLGEASELYHHPSGVNIEVKSDSEGRACTVLISDPTHKREAPGSFKRLVAVANELFPPSERGQLRGRAGDIGNCANVRYADYEQVVVVENENSCYAQVVEVMFKRDSCPRPRSIPGLSPVTK